MKIFSDLGFEPVFFFAQIINFLILAYIFKRYLYKPVLKMLHDREHKISQGLKDAESARLALEKADLQKDELIKTATLEAEKIIDETKKAAVDLRLKLTEDAKRESEKIILEAKHTADFMFEQAQRKAESNALELSRKLLDRIIGEIFTKEEKNKIIQRGIVRLEKYE